MLKGKKKGEQKTAHVVAKRYSDILFTSHVRGFRDQEDKIPKGLILYNLQHF